MGVEGPPTRLMAEFEAWQATSAELRKLGFEGWDDPKLKVFHATVKLWGEQLGSLRGEQKHVVRMGALRDAEWLYEEVMREQGS